MKVNFTLQVSELDDYIQALKGKRIDPTTLLERNWVAFIKKYCCADVEVVEKSINEGSS